MTPFNFNKLLVCLDLTEMDDYLMRYARFITDKFSSETVVFMHVMDSYEYPEELSELFSDEKVNSLKELIAGEVTEKMLKSFGGSSAIPFQYSVNAQGDEAQAIYDYAKKNSIDLVISGTSLKSNFATLIADSISEKLADVDKDIPLMVVKDQKKITNFLKALFD
jgi:K+-sensing histidine kinase KdpD